MPSIVLRAAVFLALAVLVTALGVREPRAAGALLESDAVWIELASDRPLFGHVAAYDSAADRMVLWGGEFDVYEPPVENRQLDLKRGTWSKYQPTGDGPESRAGAILRGARAALDEGENVVVVACDCVNGPTHLLDLERDVWLAAPGDGAHSRSNALLAYDPVGDQVILYGGMERSLPPLLRSGMAYDMSTDRTGWRDLPDAPFALADQAVALAPAAEHVLAFGGQDESGLPSAALWRLDLARLDEAGAWRDITADIGGDGAPSARMGATLSMDPASGTALLFGGYGGDGNAPDAWLLDYSDPGAPQWRELSTTTAPEGRAGHSAVWDSERGRLLTFGGVSSGRSIEVLADTWALTDASFAPRPAYLPAAKRSAR